MAVKNNENGVKRFCQKILSKVDSRCVTAQFTVGPKPYVECIDCDAVCTYITTTNNSGEWVCVAFVSLNC
jgi:hypothetical protein